MALLQVILGYFLIGIIVGVALVGVVIPLAVAFMLFNFINDRWGN